jgi:pimeloyl-ACP methyl ester carboxylesterase
MLLRRKSRCRLTVASPAAFALLHGGGQGSWVWSDVAARLEAAGARVLLLDVPGCGAKRGRDISNIGVPAIASELLADLDAAGIEQAVLVGHSLAGAILPEMAAQHPQGFRRLIYVSCTAPLPGHDILSERAERDASNPALSAFTQTGAKPRPEDLYPAMFCNDMEPAEAQAFLGLLGADHWPMAVFAHRDWRYDHLASIPASYIVCERDQALPPEWQRRFAERLKAQHLLSIQAGHQAMQTQPDALVEMLLALINNSVDQPPIQSRLRVNPLS